MSRPRYRLRTAILLVAVVGLGLGAKRAGDRWRFCMGKAAHHSSQERYCRENPEGYSFVCGTYVMSLTPAERQAWDARYEAEAPARRAKVAREAAHHASMSRRWRRAAWGFSKESIVALQIEDRRETSEDE